MNGTLIAAATIIAVSTATVTAQSPSGGTVVPTPVAQEPLLVPILREAASAARGTERDFILGRVSIALARAGDSVAALQIADSITERSLRSGIHAEVGVELARAGDLIAVRQALAATTRGYHKAMIHRALAVALARTGDTAAAVRQAKGHLRGVDLAQALAGIVEAQLQHGDIAGALKTAGKIGTWRYEKAMKADALRAVAEAQGDSTGSKGTFEKARDLARRLPASDIKGDSPQATVLESIALTQAHGGDLDGALQTIEDIDRGSFKVDGLLAVAKAQMDAGDRVGSERLLDRAADTARALGEHDWGSLQRVATAYARIGNAAAAHAAANAIPVTRKSVYVKVLALGGTFIRCVNRERAV